MSAGRQYRIEGVLGKGGFGTVYRAQLLGEGGFTRSVALKVLNADMEGMEDVARRLRDEARLLGLLRHRSILQVDGLVRLRGRWTVVMEFIEGADLQKVARAGGVPLGPAVEIIGEVASALHVAYNTTAPGGGLLRLLHRDIKPPNIILTSQGEIKVLDFGIARAEFSDREAETKSVLFGSIVYMAPERLDFEELHEGDVYSLGTVFYEILSGTPFGKASIRTERHQRNIDQAIELLHNQLDELPEDAEALLRSMLSYDPEDRPTAREVERRCRTIRQEVEGSWLRDWAEVVVPPLVDERIDVAGDDFSGSIVQESAGLSDVVEGAFDSPVSSTMPIAQQEPAQPPVAIVPPVPPRVPARRPRRRVKKKSSFGAVLTGMGLMGCLGVSAVGGAFVVLLLLLIIGLAVEDDVADPEIPAGIDAITQPNDTGGVTLDFYGAPTGPTLRAALSTPWSEMDLPMGSGVSGFSDSKTLVVTYGGGPVRPMAEIWAAELHVIGWRSEYDVTSGETVSMTFTKGDTRLSLGVTPSTGNLIVSMILTPK